MQGIYAGGLIAEIGPFSGSMMARDDAEGSSLGHVGLDQASVTCSGGCGGSVPCSLTCNPGDRG